MDRASFSSLAPELHVDSTGLFGTSTQLTSSICRPAVEAAPTPPMIHLEANKVHVWARSLDVPAPVCALFERMLSAGERERAARFRFAEHRDRYIVAHGWMRRVLSAYLGIPPTQIEFSFGARGKPALSDLGRSSDLQFNLAHSEGMALLAITDQTPVGIDLERLRPLQDADDLVARFFSPHEIHRFSSLRHEQKTTAFFNLWTRKEAWLKATGEGIAHLLGQVEVSFVPGESARLVKLPEGFAPLSSWSIFELTPAPGFAAACVVASGAAQLECRNGDWMHFALRP